jgi:hypothetical protein
MRMVIDTVTSVGWILCRRCSGGLLAGKDLYIETDLIDG